MRKIREALRLHASGLSTRKIATSLGVGQSTVSEYLKRIERAALTWPLAAEMTDVELEALLFHPVGGASRLVEAQPDWPVIHRELKRPGVTLSLLWEEYRAVHPDGYGYSRFCDLHRRWTGRLTPVAPKVRGPAQRASTMLPESDCLSITREPRWRSSTRQRAKFVRRSCSWPPLGLRT